MKDEKEGPPTIHVTDPEILRLIPEDFKGPDPEEIKIFFNIPRIIADLRSGQNALDERLAITERRLRILESRKD